jgi:hypothetical protein
MATPPAAFGPGILIITRTDTAQPIPINVGYAQELNLDFSGTTKQLFGQNQYPLVSARGTVKSTGKWKAAVLSGIAWNNAFYGMSAFSTIAGSPMSTSGLGQGVNIAWNVGATYTLSTSTNQIQVGSSLSFDADLGVIYVNSGLPFQRVATGSESSGKYSVNSTAPGFYNFSAADTTSLTAGASQPIKVTYTNVVTSPAGQSLIVTNQAIGFTPTFQLDYYTSLSQPAAKPFVVRVYACVAAKHMMAAKLEDFIMPEFDFDIFANNAGQVVNYVFPEVS